MIMIKIVKQQKSSINEDKYKENDFKIIVSILN